MKIWVVVVSYGLNGADAVAAFSEEPDKETVDRVARDAIKGTTYYSGWDVQEVEVDTAG